MKRINKWKERPRIRELLLTFRLLRQNPLVIFGLVVIIVLIFVSIFAPFLAPYDPLVQDIDNALLYPSWEHPFGTDRLGRDALSRVIFGSRYSLFAGVAVVSISTLIGVPVGLISGFLGGKTDESIMRVTDIFLAFPGLLLAMYVVLIVGPGLYSATAALGLVWWTTLSRITRANVLSEKEKDYAKAARAMGKSGFSILFGEILPNCWGPIIVTATMNVGRAILAAAALSFIGVGAQPPTPEWGLMISQGRKYLLGKAYLTTIPGAVMLVVVLAFVLFGDGLRDVLDPTLRHR